MLGMNSGLLERFSALESEVVVLKNALLEQRAVHTREVSLLRETITNIKSRVPPDHNVELQGELALSVSQLQTEVQHLLTLCRDITLRMDRLDVSCGEPKVATMPTGSSLGRFRVAGPPCDREPAASGASPAMLPQSRYRGRCLDPHYDQNLTPKDMSLAEMCSEFRNLATSDPHRASPVKLLLAGHMSVNHTGTTGGSSRGKSQSAMGVIAARLDDLERSVAQLKAPETAHPAGGSAARTGSVAAAPRGLGRGESSARQDQANDALPAVQVIAARAAAIAESSVLFRLQHTLRCLEAARETSLASAREASLAAAAASKCNINSNSILSGSRRSSDDAQKTVHSPSADASDVQHSSSLPSQGPLPSDAVSCSHEGFRDSGVDVRGADHPHSFDRDRTTPPAGDMWSTWLVGPGTSGPSRTAPTAPTAKDNQNAGIPPAAASMSTSRSKLREQPSEPSPAFVVPVGLHAEPSSAMVSRNSTPIRSDLSRTAPRISSSRSSSATPSSASSSSYQPTRPPPRIVTSRGSSTSSLSVRPGKFAHRSTVSSTTTTTSTTATTTTTDDSDATSSDDSANFPRTLAAPVGSPRLGLGRSPVTGVPTGNWGAGLSKPSALLRRPSGTSFQPPYSAQQLYSTASTTSSTASDSSPSTSMTSDASI